MKDSKATRFPNMRQAMLGLLLTALVPALFVHGFVYYKWYETRLATERSENLALARSVALTVNEYIQDVRHEGSATGAAMAAFGPDSAERANELLKSIADASEWTAALHWADLTGTIIASSVRESIGLSVADRPCFEAVVAGKDWSLSDRLAEKGGNEPAVVVACGIRVQGDLRGVVMATVETAGLEHRLEGTRAAGHVVVVWDSAGVPVFRLPRVPLARQSGVEQDALLRAALAGQEGVGHTVGLDGRPQIGARVPVRNLGWVAGTGRPREEVVAPLLRSLLLTLGVIVLVIVVSASVAIVIGRRIVRDVRHLQAHAAAVGRGELDHAVDVTGIAELRDLADAYQAMAARRKEAEAALLRMTAELARSNRDLEQFAYVASHDLQEPLRMIAGYLQLIERRYKDGLDAEGRQFVEFAVDGARRMQQLITDLLVYARVETRGRPPGPTDCNAALGDVLVNLRGAIEEHKATLTHDPLPTVPADATQLRQLLQNLISNAIKFRGAEPPRIHVGARCQDGEWLFSVRDNGIGLEKEHFERIFAMFQRLHTSNKYPGSGIGLAICKKIVERHGGRIWVESEPDKGATFYFTLPGAEEARS